MIPISLTLHNFMSYREAELDFDFGLACLAGDNGHGKSALLDAMTWALWGSSRLGSRRDDELIHLGQAEMEVKFIFALNDKQYRVVRKRTKKRGSLALHRQLGGKWTAMTGSTQKDTQHSIDSILRMGYNTFIASAFLLQGRADEFTVKPPGERKQVLAEILGLEMWDLYRERAKTQAKTHQAQIDSALGSIEEIKRQAEELPKLRAQWQSMGGALEQIGHDIAQAEEDLAHATAAKDSAQAKAQKAEHLNVTITTARQEAEGLTADWETASGRITSYEALLADEEVIEERSTALTISRASLAQHDARREKHLAQKERLSGAEQQLAIRRADLEREVTFLENEIAILQAKVDSVFNLREALGGAQRSLEEINKLKDRRDALNNQLAELRAQSAAITSENNLLQGEMEALRDKVDLLESSEEPTCPLCETELGDRKAEVIASLTADGQAKSRRYKDNRSLLSEFRGQSSRIETEVEEITPLIAGEEEFQSRRAALDLSVREAEGAVLQLGPLRSKLGEMEAQLVSGHYAVDLVREKSAIQDAINEIGYDAAIHQKLRERIEELTPYEDKHHQLQTARAMLEATREETQRILDQIKKKQDAIAAATQEREELGDSEANLLVAIRARTLAEMELSEIKKRELSLREELARLEQQIEHCETLRQRQAELEVSIKDAKTNLLVYEELTTAFGKSGVQAMIIDGAIPEIEDQANELLAKMTDGRMSVRMETQRQAKSGRTMETLDILIQDELGTRAYELFSGGERFRIDFAIRIALSKLLAHRAGARLQTLVIDEGFGSQDASGRERLVEAINSIREDFEKIIVITHIEELRDMFPVRVQVTKGVRGSEIGAVS